MKIGIVFFSIFFFLQSVSGVTPFQTQAEVEDDIARKINADPALKARILQQVFGRTENGNDWQLHSFKFISPTLTQVEPATIQGGLTQEEWDLAGAVEVCNPLDYELTGGASLVKSWSRSNSATTSHTFSTSFAQHSEAEVSILIATVRGGTTFTVGYEYETSETTTEEVGGSITFYTPTCPAKKGIVLAGWIPKIKGQGIPWTAKFEPTPETRIQIVFVGQNGSACFYNDANFSGSGGCLNLYQDQTNLKNYANIDNDSISSIKIAKGAAATAYEHANYTGRRLEIIADMAQLPREMDNKISSIKVWGNVIQKFVTFSEIKSLIPSDMIQMDVSGKIDFDWVDAKVAEIPDMVRFVPYEMDPDTYKNCISLQPGLTTQTNQALQTDQKTKPEGSVRPQGQLKDFDKQTFLNLLNQGKLKEIK